jgi:hypothetical protein
MHRGSVQVFLGLFLILGGFVMIKMTDQNMYWALIVLGAFVGSKGGIEISRLSGE